MKNLLETQQSQVIRNSFKKLKVGHFLQGLAFLIMLIILFITYKILFLKFYLDLFLNFFHF